MPVPPDITSAELSEVMAERGAQLVSLSHNTTLKEQLSLTQFKYTKSQECVTRNS